jgi:hypothetical protein
LLYLLVGRVFQQLSTNEIMCSANRQISVLVAGFDYQVSLSCSGSDVADLPFRRVRMANAILSDPAALALS